MVPPHQVLLVFRRVLQDQMLLCLRVVLEDRVLQADQRVQDHLQDQAIQELRLVLRVLVVPGVQCLLQLPKDRLHLEDLVVLTRRVHQMVLRLLLGRVVL